MTRQEIFNIVWNGLKSQKFEQSTDATMRACAYRGSHNRKCAAGWLLPDIECTEENNRKSISGVAYFRDNFSHSDFEFIHNLQRIHDTNIIAERMETALINYAKTLGLEIPQ